MTLSRLVSALAAAALLPLLAAPFAWGQAAPPPASVIVDDVVASEIEPSQVFMGTIVPLRRSVVGSAVDGRVQEFLASKGKWVEQGAPLAELLKETISIEVEAARAEHALRKYEYEELKNGSLPEEVRQSEARLAQAHAQMEFAKAREKRWKALFEQGRSTSREEYEEVRSASVAAEQEFISAGAANELVRKGPREERVLQAKARMEVALQQLNLLEDRHKKYTIRAPFAGYVITEHTEVGQWINKGDLVAEVIEIAPDIRVEVSVPESHITGLELALAARHAVNQPTPALVQVDAVHGTNDFAEAVVEQVVRQADLKSRTFTVQVRLPNPAVGDGFLYKAGMLTHVKLPVGRPEQLTMAPKDALVLGGASPVVFAVATDPATKQPTARLVPVRTGLAAGALVQVSGDLKPGEKVVVRGNERLRPGQPLAPRQRAVEEAAAR